MNKTYTPLEQSILSELGPGAVPSFSTSAAVDLFTTTNFLYSFAIMLIVVVAGWRYMLAGIWRMQASQAGMTKSNNEFRRVTLGLLGVLSLFLILYTFNKGLLKGDVGLEGLKSRGAVSSGAGGLSTVVPTAVNPSSNTSSRSCDTTASVITQLSSQTGICGGTRCSALGGCTYQQYLPIIRSESSRQGVDEKLVIAILCTESKGKANAENTNPDGTKDCGLMQLNRNGSCDSASFDPATNIAAGVAHLKRVVAAAGQVYQNIPLEAGIAATYNCCSNGTKPNTPSVDCTQAAGFPYSIPKWACPINPGDSQYNMCAVKAYGCGVSACVKQLSGADL